MAVSAIAQEQHGDEIRASITRARGDMLTGQREHSRQVRQERETSQRGMDQLVQQAGTDQQNERSAVRRDVDVHRRSWTDEQRTAMDRAAADADSAGADGQAKITRAGDDGEREAAGHIDDGNRDVAAARTKAESDAAAQRRDAEAESSEGGFFSWLGSKVTAFFDGVKNAIHAVFDLARKAVQAAIRKAQELAARAIDAARRAVIAAIRAVGDALIAIGGRLLAGFPGLRDRFRRAIRERVAAAERAVNAIADGLKRGIQAALDLLGRALTALLNAYEAMYRMAVDFVAGAVRSAIDAARQFIQALAEWGQIIADIAAHPGQWLRNLGRAAIDGVRNCLWGALKRAVKEWFRSKVEEVIGVAKVIYQILMRGCISFADVARMAWDGLKAAIPGMLIQLLIEKLIALIIPAAGALSLIIDGLRAAWSAASRILQAFQRFMAFLRKVGRGGPEAAGAFANMLAAAAVAVLDFLANFLISRLRSASSQIGGRLRALAQAIQRRLGGVARAVMGGVRAARRGVVAAARTVTRLARRAVQAVGRGAVRLAQAVARSPVGRIVARAGRAFMRTRVGQALGRYTRSARNWFSRKAQQFRAWRERRRKRREAATPEQRLDRAASAISPALDRMLAAGTSGIVLFGRLLWWRARYRLSSLAVDREGGDRVAVTARVNPWRRVGRGVVPAGEELRRLVERAAEEVLRHPDFAGLGLRADRPLPVAGGRRGFPAIVRFLRRRGERGLPTRTDYRVGEAPTLVTEMAQPGGRSLFGAFVRGPGAYTPTKPTGLPRSLAVQLDRVSADTGADTVTVASAIRQFVRTGRLARIGERVEGVDPGRSRKTIAQASALLFGRESVRRPANVAFSAMTLDLVAREKMSWDQAFNLAGTLPATADPRLSGGAFPMSMRGAQQTAADLQAGGLPTDLAPEERAERIQMMEEMKRREIELAQRWLATEMTVEGQRYFDSEAHAQNWIYQRLLAFYRLRRRAMSEGAA